jgi:signal transduction histidine kinase
MKLLPATSFFLFFIILLAVSSCKSDKNTIPPEILKNEQKAKKYRRAGNYDSAVFFQKKALKRAVELKDIASIKENYNGMYFNYRSENPDSTIFYIDKLYNLSSTLKDTFWMAKCFHRKGLIFDNNDKPVKALKEYIDAKDLFLKINDTIQAGRVLLNISHIQKAFGNFSLSQFSALEGLTYLESNKDEGKSLSGFNHILSVVLKENGEYEAALEKNSIALQYAYDTIYNKKIKEIDIIKFKNTRANIFKDTGEFDEAINIYKSLLDEANQKEKKDTLEIARIKANLGYTLYLKNGFNTESQKLLNQSLNEFEESDNPSGLNSVYIKLTEFYSQENQSKSLEFANKAIKNAEKMSNLKTLLDVWEVKFKTQNDISKEDRDNYFKAKQDFESEQKKVSLLFVNKKFDYEDFKKKKIIAENKASQRTILLLIAVLALLVFLIATAIIYLRIKRQHKIEKLKTVHITEARISSKVHDELANDLYELISQLETSNPNKEVVLDKLDTIYNHARDISKQIQSVDTGKGFPDELSNLFRSYQSNAVNVLLKRYDIEIWNGISSHIKTTIYRVLQELLTNMKKHSNAALVVVSIEKQNKQLFIQYIDNGKGFTEEISKNGLQNAENRIHAIKGKLTFDTQLQKGCKFSINVPV